METGVLEEGCRHLNEVFFHFITTGRPLVVLKYAMTLDGKAATRTGASRWITGPKRASGCIATGTGSQPSWWASAPP